MTGGTPAGPDKDTLTRRSHHPPCILHLESTEMVEYEQNNNKQAIVFEKDFC